MEDLDIIEERDGYRVRLAIDTDAERPYDDGACPILQLEASYYGRGNAEPFNTQANGFEDAYNRFIAYHGTREAIDLFERYLRIFHGTKSFAEYHVGVSNEYGYIAFDTKAWLEEIGVTEKNPDIEPVDRAEPCLDEVKAWATGDVYGWIVEREVKFRKQYLDEDGDEVTAVEHGTEWAEVDSCWGFYGREYAEMAAKEALADTIENN